jgi:hypothetical protein
MSFFNPLIFAGLDLAGGGGASNTYATSGLNGGGGSSGGYIEAVLVGFQSGSTFSYTVGNGRAGGAFGVNKFVGGTGGSDVIIVEESYA